MAIKLAIPSNSVKWHDGDERCGRRGVVHRSRRGQVCPGAGFGKQSRGRSHDAGDSNEVVVKLLPLVKRVALQLRAHLPAHVELDDLVSDGTLGLIDAVRKFDPAKGVTIESYARYRIRGAILDSLRDQDHASRDMRRRMKKIESTCRELERRLGRPVEDAEMASAMGLDLEQWHGRLAELQRLGFEGTGSRILPESCKRVNEEDIPTPREENPFALCYRREQWALLSRALDCLSPRERSIITLYYRRQLTMKQIGARLGIDESRVSQLHSGSMARLRSRVAEMLRRPLRIRSARLNRMAVACKGQHFSTGHGRTAVSGEQSTA